MKQLILIFQKLSRNNVPSDISWMMPKIKKISVCKDAFAASDSTEWRTLRNKVKREIGTAKTIMQRDLDILKNWSLESGMNRLRS